MGSFRDALQSSINTAISPAAPPPAAPATPAPSTPEATPAAAAPATLTPAETPVETPVQTGTVPTPDTAPAETSAPAIDAGEAAPPEEFTFEDEAPATPVAVDEPPADEKLDWKSMLPKEVESAFLRTRRGQRMMESFKLSQALEKLPADGGMGRMPTAQEIVRDYGLANNFSDMVQDFNAADPARTDRFIQGWLGLGEGRQPSVGANVFAGRFLETLATAAEAGNQHAEALYKEAIKPGITRLADELYRRADSTTDPEMRTVWYNVAQLFDQHFFGNVSRTVTEAMLKGEAPPPPIAHPKEAEISQREQALTEREQQQWQQRNQGIINAINTAVRTNVDSDIDYALGFRKDGQHQDIFKHFTPETARNLAEAFRNQLLTKMRAAGTNLDGYKRAVDLARQQPTQQNINSASSEWARVARSFIRELRASYISNALKPFVSESAARHQTLSDASRKVVTTSAAQSTEKNLNGGPPKRLPGESYPQHLQRILKAVITA